MNFKSLVLGILLSFSGLTGCSNNKPSSEDLPKMDLDYFYSSIEGMNFSVNDNEYEQIFYSHDAMIQNITGQRQTGIVRLKDQGIFEIHTLDNGEFETHGMLSPNFELEYTDFLNNFYRIKYLDKSNWRTKEDGYTLPIVTGAYSNLTETGYFVKDEEGLIENIKLTADETKREFYINVKYEETAKKEDFILTIKDIGNCKNEKLENYVKTALITRQTDWNDYQMSAIKAYGFWDVPYFQAFTKGLKLYFQSYAAYGSGGYIFLAFDYMSDKNKETEYARELQLLGYTRDSTLEGDGVNAFVQEETPGYNRVISFKYIPVEEIDSYERVAFPYGYMQVSYNYALSERTSSVQETDELLNSVDLPSISDPDLNIKKVTIIDYKKMMNDEAMSEENIAIFEEAGIEPGPVYDIYCSIFFYIDKKADAIAFIDDYMESIDRKIYRPTELFDDGDSIEDIYMNSAEYYHVDFKGRPESVIDIYLNDSSYQTWTGVVEFVITKYTETGKRLFF